MDEDYTQSDISKEVKRLMDEEGFEFGEAVKEAMSKGYRDGGLMIAIQKLAQGGMAGNKTYHQFHDQYVPMDEESMGYAYGGGIGSMMQPKRQGLFMGGSPLTGQALNIYNSMNAYGYTDQEIANRLSGSGLYTPPGTTPPPTTPPTTPPSGGGGGGGDGGGDGGVSIFDIKNRKNRDTLIDKGIAAANADKGNLMLEEITAMNDLSGQESMRGQITPKTTLEKIISSDKPNMLDIAGTELPVNEDIIDRGNPTGDSRIVSEEQGLVGTPLTFAETRRAMTQPGFTDKATVYDPYGIKVEDGRFSYDMNKTSVDDFKKGLDIPDRNRGMEVNENFIDRGDPMNDIRVVSEEQGLVGGIPDRNRGQITSTPTGGITTIDKPNMRDIAGPSTTVDESISIEDFSKPFSDEVGITGQKVSYPGNQTGILNAPPSIGLAQDPDVEDPFGGKYTPSFEEKKEAEGIIAGLLENIKSYNPLQLDNVITSLASRGIFDIAGISNPYGLISSAAGLGYKELKKKLTQNKTAQISAAAKTKKDTRKIQARTDAAEKKRQEDIAKRDSTAAAKKAANEGRAYDYSGRSNKQGTHTSTISKEKAQDNQDRGRGQQSSGGSKSSGGSSSKGSTSSGAGGGGGASRGRGRDRDDRMAKGGRVAKAIR